jgi:hypothetical protein
LTQVLRVAGRDDGAGADAVAVRREIYERRTIHQDYLTWPT